MTEMTANSEAAPTNEPKKPGLAASIFGLLLVCVVLLVIIGAIGRVVEWVNGGPLPGAVGGPPLPTAPAKVEVRTLDLHKLNRFSCNSSSIPDSEETAETTVRFYRGGDMLILSGNIRVDGFWEEHGEGLRYKSLTTTAGGQTVRAETPAWFNVDRAVIVGSRGGKSLVRLEGHDTMLCISEFN